MNAVVVLQLMIRVGRRMYNDTRYCDPHVEGFYRVLCLTKSTKYGSLSPYELFDDGGRNMENIWQAHKVYETIPNSTQRYSRFDNRIIWKYPAQQHMREGKILPDYWSWRESLMNNLDAVRYPVGYQWRHKCIGAVLGTSDDYEIVDYITARKKIYLPHYTKLVKSNAQFQQLASMLASGTNLLVVEIDGPHQESIDYYKEKYGVADDFITDNTILVTHENMDIMLNDPKHPFGHGYCLAMALLDLNI